MFKLLKKLVKVIAYRVKTWISNRFKKCWVCNKKVDGYGWMEFRQRNRAVRVSLCETHLSFATRYGQQFMQMTCPEQAYGAQIITSLSHLWRSS